jgi:hypothetical protein
MPLLARRKRAAAKQTGNNALRVDAVQSAIEIDTSNSAFELV